MRPLNRRAPLIEAFCERTSVADQAAVFSESFRQ
jgi:hypothetical protein